jgi:hypothetical protein
VPLALVAIGALAATSPASAAIAPPWCETPMPPGAAPVKPDSAENLSPTAAGAFPHIPYYAVGCTLERIKSESNGRMDYEIGGYSALGRPLYKVVINEVSKGYQKQAYFRWTHLRKVMLTDPAAAQALLASYDGDVKVPLFIQGSIHGNEYEGLDAAMMAIERLATTPYGADPEVDALLDGAILVFNPVQNPDGRIAGTRANGNGFDLNRDFLTQSQSETVHSIKIMQEWLAPDMLDLHLQGVPTLIEATTKPHNPSIDYDLWLKWNQSRIDANEAAMNAIGLDVQRPINEWCPEANRGNANGLCDDGSTPGPAVAEGWDDWGPFYTPMYSQHIGLNGSTVEACMSAGTACGPSAAPGGRIVARTSHFTVTWSTLLYDVGWNPATKTVDESRKVDLMHDQFEIYRRGVTGAARPACCPAPFDVANNWMHEFPTAYVIPVGNGQRSDAEANRLVSWLLFNGIEVSRVLENTTVNGQAVERGSYVVLMKQPHRGLADTSLDIGVDISQDITQLYAPPAAWSHGYLWGADILKVDRNTAFTARTARIAKPTPAAGGIDHGTAEYYALEIDSATAVRTLNALLKSGLTAKFATAPFTRPDGRTFPAGTVLFPAGSVDKAVLGEAGRENGLFFWRVQRTTLSLEDVDRSPRIAVLSGGVDQQVWSLRNLGFTADPVNTPLNNAAAPDPLADYDLVFTTGNWPTNTTARARLTAFFARGGGLLGAGSSMGRTSPTNSGFLEGSGLAVGLGAASRSGGGQSGIVWWNNLGGATSPVTGAYPGTDTAIVDPPTWFTSVPAGFAIDANLPMSGFFAAGLWLFDAQSASAPGATLVAHGTSATAGSPRITVFAFNPLYRADPEREWPALASAALWADQ